MKEFSRDLLKIFGSCLYFLVAVAQVSAGGGWVGVPEEIVEDPTTGEEDPATGEEDPTTGEEDPAAGGEEPGEPEGGELGSFQALYSWGTIDTGLPIMYRRGANTTYRGVTVGSGNGSELLLSTAEPTSDDIKFQRMNLNPCYLGSCNLLAMVCEKDCTTYEANPYFITELTDDVQNVIQNLKLITPIQETKNKSNFTFLPVFWAHNLFHSWTAYPGSNTIPSEKAAHPARTEKKQAVILVVNAPDRFEPNELTYLGFNNDNSEIPMEESDCIRFDTGRTAGTKGIIKYAGAGTFDDEKKQFIVSSGSGKLTFPEKGLVKIVVEPCSAEHSGRHKITGAKTFTFSGPILPKDGDDGLRQANTSTRGKNFGHNLSLNKLKYSLENAQITSCVLKGQVLRDYVGQYGRGQPDWNGSTGVKPLILSDGTLATRTGTNAYSVYGLGITTSGKVDDVSGLRDALRKFADPCMILENNPTVSISEERADYDRIVEYRIKGLTEQSILIYSLGFKGGRIHRRTDISPGLEGYYRCACNTVRQNMTVSSGTDWQWKISGTGAASVCTCDHSVWLPVTFDPIGGFDKEIISVTLDKGSYNGILECYVLNGREKEESKTLGTTSAPQDNTCVYLFNNNWICFNGDGELDVTVAPVNTSAEAYVTFYDDNRLAPVSISGNGGIYSINKRTEFYIESSQITSKDGDNYVINLTYMGSIKLISAEITNRKYVKYTSKVTRSGNKFTSTYTPETFTITVEPTVEKAYITFSSPTQQPIFPDDSNTATYYFFGEKTFNFSKFWLPRDYVKLKYTHSPMSKVTEKVTNRTIEWYGGANGASKSDKDVSCELEVSGGWDGDAEGEYTYVDSCRTGCGAFEFCCYKEGKIKFTFSTEIPTEVFFRVGAKGWYHECTAVRDPQYGHMDGKAGHGHLIVDKDGKVTWHYFPGRANYIFQVRGLYREHIRFYQAVGHLKDIAKTYTFLSPGEISFYGRGAVSFKATAQAQPKITLAKGDRSTETINIEEKKTITISPDKYLYTKSGNEMNGYTYTVQVNCTNCKITGFKQITKTTSYRYSTPNPPENSRYVNFFQNSGSKPVRYPPNLIAYGSDEDSNLTNTGIEYKDDLVCWVTKASSDSVDGYSAHHHFYNKDIIGDFFLTIESMNSEPRILQRYVFPDKVYSLTEFSGMYRIFRAPDELRWSIGTTMDIIRDRSDITDVDCKMSYAGFTLPLNYALYQNGYQHVNEDGGLMEYPDDALKKVTADACEKLKAENRRIYVVKYLTDYNPYENCGAAITERANSEEEMKVVLEKIAEDIKTFAGYKDPVIEDETEDKTEGKN